MQVQTCRVNTNLCFTLQPIKSADDVTKIDMRVVLLCECVTHTFSLCRTTVKTPRIWFTVTETYRDSCTLKRNPSTPATRDQFLKWSHKQYSARPWERTQDLYLWFWIEFSPNSQIQECNYATLLFGIPVFKGILKVFFAQKSYNYLLPFTLSMKHKKTKELMTGFSFWVNYVFKRWERYKAVTEVLP